MKAFIIALYVMALTSCASLDSAITGGGAMPTKEDRQKSVATLPELSTDQQQKFVEGIPWIGMTDGELHAMWNSNPQKTQQKLTSQGPEEVRLYHLRVGDWKSGIVSKYYRVNLVNGKLTELQELDPRAGSFDNL